MIYQMMDIIGLKIVQYRHGDSPIGKRREDGDCPFGTVTATECYFVAGLQA
ncbi:hypothetical protein IMSAGC008_02072 [Muribaculaceae bacterium]|nr:hypothetical protein IMSAGC008_02072 [Muribaculaceae bacterium]